MLKNECCMRSTVNIILIRLQLGEEDVEAAAADGGAAKAMQRDATHASEAASSKEPVQLVLRIGRGLTPEPVIHPNLQFQPMSAFAASSSLEGCQALVFVKQSPV